MSKQRVQVVQTFPYKGIEVVARPVNMMVEQVRPARTNSALQLAEALRSIRPQIEQYLEQRHQEYTEGEIARGREAALKHAIELKEAQDKGLISPDENPYFVQGFLEQRGRIKGDEFAAQLMADYETEFNPEVEDIVSFINTKRQEFLETVGESNYTNPAFLDSFNGRFREIQQHLLNIDISNTRKRILEEKRDNTWREIWNAFQAFAQKNDYAALSDTLNAISSRERLAGSLSGADINKMMVDAAVEAAKEYGDESFLDALMLKRPDGTPGPGSTKYGQEQITDAKEWIMRDRWRQEDRYWVNYTREKQLAKENLLADVATLIHDDPRATIPPHLMEKWRQIDPTIDTTIHNLRKVAMEGEFIEDPQTVAKIAYRVLTLSISQQELAALAHGPNRELSFTTYYRFANDLRQNRNNKRHRDFLSSSVFRQARDYVRRYTAPSFNLREEHERQATALMNFDQAASFRAQQGDWDDLSPHEQLRELRAIGDDMIKAYAASSVTFRENKQPSAESKPDKTTETKEALSPLFPNLKAFISAVEEFQQSAGTKGPIADLARKHNIDIKTEEGQSRLNKILDEQYKLLTTKQ